MIDKKSFKKAVAIPLEKHGFAKKGQSWYLDGKDAIAVLNLQKNDWADEYFINIGIWIKYLREAEYPKAHECHLSHRVESLFPQEMETIHNGCSLEKGTNDALAKLASFIEIKLVPFLRECTEADNLKKMMAMGRFKLGFVHISAKFFLENSGVST